MIRHHPGEKLSSWSMMELLTNKKETLEIPKYLPDWADFRNDIKSEFASLQSNQQSEVQAWKKMSCFPGRKQPRSLLQSFTGTSPH